VYADDVKLCNDAAKECLKIPEKHVTVAVRKASESEEYFWTTWEISALQNELGSIIGIISIGHDVTNTHSVVNRTSDLSDSVKTILDLQNYSFINHIPGVVYRCIADEKLTINFFSEGIELLTGYPSSYFSTERKYGYDVLIDKDDILMIESTIAIANKHKYEMEYRIIHKDTEIRWVFERGGVIFDPITNQSYIDGSIFDVTPRKKVEAALARSEDEVKGKKIGYSLDGPKVEERTKVRLKYSSDNKLAFKEEFLSYAKNGNAIWVEVDCQPLFDENNIHIGFMDIENDITRRRQHPLMHSQ
jgi:PAS domain-containing protein